MIDIEKILCKVEKPGRYTGGEKNSVRKNPNEVDVRFAFCFPDVYDVGMSHLGMKILYGLLNERKDTYCERVFAPWPDMEQQMRKYDVPLYSLETKTPVSEFDIVGFTMQYELSYTNMINMLDLSGIPLYAKDRTKGFVCAGGPCTYNPEPIADFVDFFNIGEGEEMMGEIIEVYSAWKKRGGTRQEFLEAVAEIDGVYVPQFYDVSYNEDGTIKDIKPNNPHAKESIKKRIINDMDNCYYPSEFVVPNIEIVHDRAVIEAFRGCIRGCRFCQAGMIYRPVREKSSDVLLNQAEKLLDSTGYEEISILSLSSSDYTGLGDLCDGLIKITEPNHINIALPSLRIDNFSLNITEKIQKVRKSSLTFAPEAGTQRMRDVINKNITEEDIRKSSHLAFSSGYNSIKLYFMLGLPTETDEDVVGIADTAGIVADSYFSIPKEERAKGVSITLSTSCFVPKPHTPFQWEAQDSIEVLEEKQRLLQKAIKSRCIRYNWHEATTSYLEGVFARGDRRLSKVLLEAQRKGCKFDSWSDFYSFERWMEVFKTCGVDPNFYNTRKRDYDEIMPWDMIDCGVSKAFLKRESEKANAGVTTPNCREKCSGCGAASFKGGICGE